MQISLQNRKLFIADMCLHISVQISTTMSAIFANIYIYKSIVTIIDIYI